MEAIQELTKKPDDDDQTLEEISNSGAIALKRARGMNHKRKAKMLKASNQARPVNFIIKYNFCRKLFVYANQS